MCDFSVIPQSLCTLTKDSHPTSSGLQLQRQPSKMSINHSLLLLFWSMSILHFISAWSLIYLMWVLGLFCCRGLTMHASAFLSWFYSVDEQNRDIQNKELLAKSLPFSSIHLPWSNQRSCSEAQQWNHSSGPGSWTSDHLVTGTASSPDKSHTGPGKPSI